MSSFLPRMVSSLLIAFTVASYANLAHAEQPYIGIGVVSHQITISDSGGEDGSVSPSTLRLTLGSRVTKHIFIEAFYLQALESDDFDHSSGLNFEIEYENIIGASVNYGYAMGPVILYGGLNINAAQFSSIASSDTVDEVTVAITNESNEKDLRINPGLNLGIDIKPFKNFSLNLNGSTYYCEGGTCDSILGTGIGAELRYHL